MSATPNSEQLDIWNNTSGENWVAAADQRDRFLAPVADVLFEQASLAEGQRVLDLGCGCGATSFRAADVVGPLGAIVGIDFSATMLSVARRRASGQSRRSNDGSAPLTFIEADAQTFSLDEPCDVAISRFGTMFYDDPVAAFTTISSNLVPGAALCIATWRSMVDNDWLMAPGSALADFLPALEEPDDDFLPGMFAQSDPEQVTDVLEAAGFTQIELTPHKVALHHGDDADAAFDYLAQTAPGRTALESVDPDRLDEARTAVRNMLAARQTEDGVLLDGGIWIVTARCGG